MEREKEKKEKAAADYAKKRAEEEEQSKKLGGRMLMILTKLAENTTPHQFTLSGLEMGGPRTRILASHVAYNSSLISLHLSRKNI
jgi:hypothetical protein